MMPLVDLNSANGQQEHERLYALKGTLESRRMLRIIAAHTDEKQFVVLERLLTKECQRITRPPK